jgi:hypothetical protein
VWEVERCGKEYEAKSRIVVVCRSLLGETIKLERCDSEINYSGRDRLALGCSLFIASSVNGED